jgi:pSer/pThr/pTyr-binding forkhead associated (FHA) protein
VSLSPLHRGTATPAELQERIRAGRRGSPFLLYRDGDGRQVIVELGEERRRLTIGRRPGNDVALSWDAEVSRLHAELEQVGTSWVVSDDGLSHNGTLVNGHHLEGRRRLRDGDVLAVGETLIAYCMPGEASTVNAPTRTAQRGSVAATLTPAQRRVLTALCRPYRDSTIAVPPSNQQIADELFLSRKTASVHVSNILGKLGVANRVQAAAIAQRLGIVADAPPVPVEDR